MPKKMPDTIQVYGEPHAHSVLLVNTRDQYRRPKLCTIIHREESIHLAGGDEFVTCYLPSKVINELRPTDVSPTGPDPQMQIGTSGGNVVILLGEVPTGSVLLTSSRARELAAALNACADKIEQGS